jgi:ribosome-associated heat shock protein Hsp15
MSKEVRVDSFLWAVRIFKTRTLAQEACKKGRVAINSITVKPSKKVSVGDVVVVRKPPVSFSFRVLAIAVNRMNAKLVPEYVENITPKEEYEAMEMQRLSG